MAGACEWPRGSIDSCLQAFSMDVFSECFHVGEILIRFQVALFVAGRPAQCRIGRIRSDVPTVIDIDVGITVLDHTA